MLHTILDLVLHLDRHLADVIATWHAWIYGLLFVIIFCETGLVVTPFLPGDSLLFAIGALAAVDGTGLLHAPLIWLLVAAAAILGNTLNYGLGRALGPKAFTGRLVLLKPEHLRRTEAFFARHGATAVLLSRFVPLVRTFVPFVAGTGRMPYATFQGWNLLGGVTWTALFVWGGYLFGNIPLVKGNFGLVTIAIVLASLLPLLWTVIRARGEPQP